MSNNERTRVKRALWEARDLLAAGWCQERSESFGFPVGDYRELLTRPLVVRHVAPDNKRQRCYCAAGAVASVARPGRILEEAIGALRREGECACLPIWNDDPDRTHEEVLALFDAAIGAHD